MAVPEWVANDDKPVEDEPDLVGDPDAFLERRNKVFEKIKDDEDAFRLCVAEIYVFICTMEQGMRKMISAGGPLAFLTKVGGIKNG